MPNELDLYIIFNTIMHFCTALYTTLYLPRITKNNTSYDHDLLHIIVNK